METALDILKEKKSRAVAVSPDTSVIVAIETMVANKIGAMLVKEGNQVVGIWTERDLLRNMLEPGFDPRTSKISDLMQTTLHSVQADTPSYRLQEMFIGLFIRHILVMKDDEFLGLLSIGDVLRSILLAKDKEIRELNKIASWEYYENWGWHHDHGKKVNK